jgi:hypothetical protein
LFFLFAYHERRINLIKSEIEDLKGRNVELQMQIGTNKLLLKQTQRLVIPNEIALAEKIPARQ